MDPVIAMCAISENPVTLNDFNASLEKEGSASNLNEGFLESKLRELEQITPHCPETSEAYWLTYARLFELALLCAGNYADHFEFAGAGDLLVNPRQILVHFRNGCTAVKKDRHRKLTEQFGHIATGRDGVVRLLKEETVPEIVKKPLLAHMQERMTESGYLSEEYLSLVESRMKRIADTIGFLAAWHVAQSSVFYLRVQCAHPAERRFIESNLCRFDKGIFFELGQDLRGLSLDPCQKCRFISRRTAFATRSHQQMTSSRPSGPT